MSAEGSVFDTLKYRVEVDEYGDRRYYNALGQLHREDGPAVELCNGASFWWQNGQLHREDGPAVEWPSGAKHWYQNGKLHREVGPAIEWEGGAVEWYQNGRYCHKDELHLKVKPLGIEN